MSRVKVKKGSLKVVSELDCEGQVELAQGENQDAVAEIKGEPRPVGCRLCRDGLSKDSVGKRTERPVKEGLGANQLRSTLSPTPHQ